MTSGMMRITASGRMAISAAIRLIAPSSPSVRILNDALSGSGISKSLHYEFKNMSLCLVISRPRNVLPVPESLS